MTPAIFQAFHDAMAQPFDGSIAEWSEQNLDLPPSYTPSGFFKPAKSRWLLGPLDALKEPRYRIVNVLKPTGTGGTLIADLFVAWRIVNKPGNIQWNWNSGDIATGHAEDRINPLFNNCRAISALTSDNRHEVRTLERKFKTGTWFRMQAGTEKRLQAKHVPVQVNDEVWQWDAGRMREADSRLGAYRRVGMSKQLNISQGGSVGEQWHERCVAGEQWEWRVPCAHCGAFFFPKMEETVGGKSKYLCDFKGDEIKVICPACDGFHVESDALKAAWNEGGKYVQLNEGASESATFRWSPFVITPWKEIVAEYRHALAAKKAGVLLPLQQFVQKVMADFWDEQTADVDPVDLRTEDYKPGVTWQVENKPGLTIDCQLNLALFYVVARGWASSGESRRLFRGRANTFDEIASIQSRFAIPSSHVFLDVGYQQTAVLQEAARRIDAGKQWGWQGLKGVADAQASGFEHIDARSGAKSRRIYGKPIYPELELGQRNHNVEQWLSTLSPAARDIYARGKLRVPVYLWSNRIVNDILQRLMAGRGASWLAPSEEAGQDEERIYRQHMAAMVQIDGKWEKVRENFPDHYRDCEAMQIVFASMAGALIGT